MIIIIINAYLQQPVYENCTCVENNLRNMYISSGRNFSDEEISQRSVVSDGACPSGCTSFVPHLIVSILALFMLFVLAVPNVFITMR